MDLLTPALIYLSLSALLVPIFHKLGLGSVLGYLTAGFIIGPHALGVVKDVNSVSAFAEFGVVFLLFIIGLELQPKKLWSMRKDLVGFGGLQILACTLGLGIIAKFFNFSWSQAMVIGFALSLSSTAFAMQTLIERKQLQTEPGQKAFAILLMQDIVAIPALALIPLLGTVAADSGLNRWTALWFLATVIVLILISRYLTRPLLRVVASIRNREIFTAITLTIVLGVSLWMHHLGLSMGLGAFLAGVLLADSEYRHELEADLEPFKGLLMGLFFISVGMAVNISLLIASPLLILALTALYQVVKGLLTLAAARVMGLESHSAKCMSLTITQGGEFAFVIFASTLKVELLPAATTEMLVLIVTLSMVASPIALAFNEKILAGLYNRKKKDIQFDDIESKSNHVIIAGYGRFGQISGRILRSLGISFTALELDPSQIELLRKFGNKVYYGDASRIDMLEKAGAADAKLLILAIDDAEASLATAKVITEHFPKLKVLARARNRDHAFKLRDLGITFIKRETFDSALDLSKEMLVELGYKREHASRLTERFKLHDESMLIEQHLVKHDEKQMISVSRQGAEQLTQVLNDDIALEKNGV